MTLDRNASNHTLDMDRCNELVTCPVCGTRYSEAEGRACHIECPLAGGCRRLSCPYCMYEVPAPTRLTRWLSRWFTHGTGHAHR